MSFANAEPVAPKDPTTAITHTSVGYWHPGLAAASALLPGLDVAFRPAWTHAFRRSSATGA